MTALFNNVGGVKSILRRARGGARHFSLVGSSPYNRRLAFGGCLASLALITVLFLACAALAQTGANAPQPATSAPPAPTVRPTSTPLVPGAGLTLYRKLRSAGLDPSAVYNIRDATIQREDLHITLDDGTIAFLQAVDGRVTGAYFEGDGEVLLVPPDFAERASLSLFTGAAVLEEKFHSAYFRFNDDTFEQLRPALRPAEDSKDFIEKNGRVAVELAQNDALRLMTCYLNEAAAAAQPDRMFRARLQTEHLGLVDLYYDTLSPEQIAVMKLTYARGAGYYDVLASFPARAQRGKGSADAAGVIMEGAAVLNRLHVASYKVRAHIEPPERLQAEAELAVDVRKGGERMEFFELSRYLKLSQVLAGGKPLEFLQNEAIEGSALARRGNDVVAVIFPEPLRPGQKLQLKFVYAGNVLSDAGGGLIYVGARGVWYPNRGMAMADYDLEFRYPAEWTLVATGKRVGQELSAGEQVAHYVSERPMPLAGFNIGRYSEATARAGDVLVQAFAAQNVESSLRKPSQMISAPPVPAKPRTAPAPVVLPPPPPAPARNAENVAKISARGIDFYARDFGPYPYSSLVLSQMPGSLSQGWPGLVFLSSLSFLSPEERVQLHLSPETILFSDEVIQLHETAHQWWGDLITWKSYRDQWLVEALATYSSCLAEEQERPQRCRQLLEFYRHNLLSKNERGEEVREAGPVTLGLRLVSSRFPDGFDAVSYGRGAWLLHMLRAIVNQGSSATGPDEPFVRALRKLRQTREGQEMSSADLQRVMEEELPPSVRYEGQRSLDWFFTTWVNGTAIPRLELKDVRFTHTRRGAVVTGKLLQKEAPDDLVTSVPVYAIIGKSQVAIGRVFADGAESSFRLTAPAGAHKLVLDPQGTLLTRP